MLRCRIELLPGGDEERARTIGLIEIANVGNAGKVNGPGECSYEVVLKKTPPFRGALKAAWRRGTCSVEGEDDEVLAGRVEGFHRTRRGVYDLLYLALRSCGLDRRNR